MSPLINEDELKEWLGFKRSGDIEKWLRQNSISYRYGKGRQVITTRSAVDKAFGVDTAANDSSNQEDEFF